MITFLSGMIVGFVVGGMAVIGLLLLVLRNVDEGSQ